MASVEARVSADIDRLYRDKYNANRKRYAIGRGTSGIHRSGGFQALSTNFDLGSAKSERDRAAKALRAGRSYARTGQLGMIKSGTDFNAGFRQGKVRHRPAGTPRGGQFF